MVGIEGMLGNEVAGNGGRLACGSVGMVGMLGSGGKVVGIGSVGCGRDGIVIVGKGGTLPIEGKGGNVGFGKVGMLGRFGAAGEVVCKRLRAARLKLIMLEKASARRKDAMKNLVEAMAKAKWILQE